MAAPATAADLAATAALLFQSINKQTIEKTVVNCGVGVVATSAVISRRQAGSAAAVAVTVVDYQKTSKAAAMFVCVECVCVLPYGRDKIAIRHRLLIRTLLLISLTGQHKRKRERAVGGGT